MLGRFLVRQYLTVYRLDRWVREHFTVTGHMFLLLLVVSGVYGVDTKSSSSYQLFVLVLFILICALLLSLFRRCQYGFIRHLPRYATVGEEIKYTLSLSFSDKRKMLDKMVFIDRLAEPLPTYSELRGFYHCDTKPWYRKGISFRSWRRYLAYQRGGFIREIPLPLAEPGNLEFKISISPVRRGKLVFEAGALAIPDMLGLFRHLCIVRQQQSLLVLPKRYQMPPLQLPGKRKYQPGGVSLANSVGDSAEFMALRDYRQGDAFNHIHWKSYARHGRLIVKEYQDEYFVRRALLLDTFAGRIENEQFEAAVSVAASIASNERQNDALLDLMFVAREAYCFTSGRGLDQLPHLLEILASVQATVEDQFSLLQQTVLSHADRCSSLVCVLLHWDIQRQLLIKQLLAQDIPVAVFLIHQGQLQQIADKPEYFYPIDSRYQLADQLAQI